MSSNVYGHWDDVLCIRKMYAEFLEPICQQWQLTRNELDVMLFLYNNPTLDRAAQIVERRKIAKSHVSLAAVHLEEMGLLHREFDERDRRTVHLKLTPQGRAIAEEGQKAQYGFFTVMQQGVSEEDMEICIQVLRKMCDNVRNLEKGS